MTERASAPKNQIKKEVSPDRLEDIAAWYEDDDGVLQGWKSVHRRLVHYRYLSMRDVVRDKSIVELGIADGEMTQYFLRDCRQAVGVDGASRFLATCGQRFSDAVAIGKLRLVESLFETYRPQERFEVVVASHILEHLRGPVAMLQHFATLLVDGGRLLVSVPNALSLHRQVAVKMGLLSRPEELNEQDLKLGHQRVYTPALLRQHIEEADLELLELRGILLKALANRQIEGTWEPELLDGFFELGKDHPELCAELLAVCRRAEGK